MTFSAAQIETLLKPIAPHRVLQSQGQSHVPAYDVAAHLTRIFGFGGWSKRILSLEKVVDEPTTTSGGKPAWTVTYTCALGLTIRTEGLDFAYYEDGAAGSSTQPQHGEAIDMAMKSAISYALKRCAAFGLGDQFGLSLYNKGSVAPLIKKTLVRPDGATVVAPDLESHIPVPRSLGNDERDADEETGEITPARVRTRPSPLEGQP